MSLIPNLRQRLKSIKWGNELLSMRLKLVIKQRDNALARIASLREGLEMLSHDHTYNKRDNFKEKVRAILTADDKLIEKDER